MKLNCGPTKAEREAARKAKREAKKTARRKWHKVFVMWPRRIGSNDCRAFETIERRWVRTGTGYGSFPVYCYDGFPIYGWEYRACQ